MNNKEKIILIIFIIIIVGIIMFTTKTKDLEGFNFKIHFFNAGKADAIILSKDDKHMMIDTGLDSLSNEILKYFKDNNISKLDYLIITHFDKDHVGSASFVIDNIDVGEVLQSNVEKESVYYSNYVNSLKNKNITPKTIDSNNYDIKLSDIDIKVMGPSIIYEKNESNNSSLIVSVTYINNKFLFMGDAENARIKDFVEINNEKYDFLKVPYHGNYLKRMDDLLKSVNSKYAVITCSNDEGCDSDTLKLLNSYNINYYLTRKGDIEVFSNGNDIIVKQ